MKIVDTGVSGLLLIEPSVFEDERGYFFESYHFNRYKEAGITASFIQDNESKSTQGVIRGLHYQIEQFAQAKLVRVVQGAVFDVAVDLRKDSPTFGKWVGIELSAKNKNQLYIPRGFAHGFSVLSETAIFTYKCDNIYNKAYERSINPLDSDLDIDWKINVSEAIVSEKDQNAPSFSNADINFNL